MRKRSNGSGLLVVVELGGAWPAHLEQLEQSGRRVLTQQEGEAPAEFVERVLQGLDGLFGRGIRLTSVVVACNERIDDAADSARRKLAGLTLGAMARHKAGRVCLATSARSSGRLRHSLAALARDLSLEWHKAGLEATVELGDDQDAVAAAANYSFTARVA
jgi:hypothetical protein